MITAAQGGHRPRILQFTCDGSYLNLFLAKTSTRSEEIAMIERRELSKEEIAERAYELYVERGGEPGKDVEDWLRAEKELSGGVVVGSAKGKVAQAGRSQSN